MAITLGDAYVKIKTDDSDFNQGLKSAENKVKSWAGRVGGFLSNAFSFAVGGVMLHGIDSAVDGLKGMVQQASDAEEMMGKFSVVFGDYAHSTANDLDAMARAMGRSKFELRGFAATFQDTFVPLGFARDDATELSKKLTELTVDVSSFNNSLEADVSRDFQSALVGNHETVRKYGIVITQAALDQELLNMGIAEGAKNASEQDKVMARLNLIMKGTADAQGDAVRTSGSWANQVRALKSAWTDFVTEVGMKVLPIITPLLGRLTEMARTVLPEVITKIGEFTSQFAGMDFTAITTKLVEWVYAPETEEQIREVGTQIAEFILGGIDALLGSPETGDSTANEAGRMLADGVIRMGKVFIHVGELIAERIFQGLVGNLQSRIEAWSATPDIRNWFSGLYSGGGVIGTLQSLVGKAWGFSEGGYAGRGLAMLGEKGKEFVLNADTTRALEARLGSLTQQNILGAVGVNGTLNVNFGGTVPSGISPDDVRQEVINQVGNLFQQHARRSR